MNEPQVWTLIGVLAATLFAVLTLLSTMFVRTVTSGFESVRREMDGLRHEMSVRFDGLHGEMNARFERVDVRLEHLDRDVQAIARRVFPEPD